MLAGGRQTTSSNLPVELQYEQSGDIFRCNTIACSPSSVLWRRGSGIRSKLPPEDRPAACMPQVLLWTARKYEDGCRDDANCGNNRRPLRPENFDVPNREERKDAKDEDEQDAEGSDDSKK